MAGSLAASNFRSTVSLNLLLMSGEHVLRRDVADGAVQTDAHCNGLRDPYPFGGALDCLYQMNELRSLSMQEAVILVTDAESVFLACSQLSSRVHVTR